MANLYSVTYNTNNSTSGTTPATQTAESNADTYTFTAPTAEQYGLAKAGYSLIGWSENQTTTIPEYSPGSTISLDKTSSYKTLYAIWSNWELLPNMQTMVPGICDAANIGDTRQIIDSRDGKEYWIAKLTDGNCWMTQNLDYNDPNSDRVTDTSGTNGGPASGKWSTNNATARQYWDPGEKIVNGSTLANANSDTDRHLLVGDYYSWLSATNGTGSSISTDGTNTDDNICPNGWRLPTSNTTGEFQALVNKGKSSWTTYNGINGYWLGGTGNVAGAAFFPAGGYVNGGSLQYAGSRGYYWSSTAVSASDTYYLYLYSSSVGPSNIYDRYRGFSLRCVAR